MAQQCLRSMGTKLPMSPLTGITLKPAITMSPSEYNISSKPVSRLQMLPLEDQISILNSYRRYPHQNPFLLLSSYGVQPAESNLIGCSRQIDLVKFYYQSLKKQKNETVMLSSSTKLSSATTSTASNSGNKPPTSSDSGPDKPNQDQLQHVHDIITDSLLKLFITTMNYSVYHPNMVFVNNIRNKTSHGILNYVQQVAMLRAIGHFKFAYVKFEILNTHISADEGRITVRWRINGISGLRVMLKFWKFRLWNWKEIMTSQEQWFDGISYFDVGADGLVFRHIVDKVMEDKGPQIIDVNPTKAALAAKLGLLASLFPQPSSLALSKKLDDSTQLYDMNNPGLQPM